MKIAGIQSATDGPTSDSSEVIHISSLALLKVKHEQNKDINTYNFNYYTTIRIRCLNMEELGFQWK